jgi:hypothetical protein
VSARTTAGQVLDSDTVDRRVNAYVKGDAHQRLGFSEDDVYTTESGFLIPDEGIEFILAAGDPLYLTGQVAGEASFVFFLITKVV